MATYVSNPVTFTGLPPLHLVSNPVTFVGLPPQHLVSNPVTFTAPDAYFMKRLGSSLIPTRLGRRAGAVIQWLGPPLD